MTEVQKKPTRWYTPLVEVAESGFIIFAYFYFSLHLYFDFKDDTTSGIGFWVIIGFGFLLSAVLVAVWVARIKLHFRKVRAIRERDVALGDLHEAQGRATAALKHQADAEAELEAVLIRRDNSVIEQMEREFH